MLPTSLLAPLALPLMTPMAGSMSTFILLAVVVFAFMFMVQRPLKKQQEAQRKLQESVQEGSRVVLTSGLFGTVTHLGDKQAIVELAPGLEVTVARPAISRTVTADEEEFEFADEADPDAGDALDDAATLDAAEQAPFAAQAAGMATDSGSHAADQQVVLDHDATLGTTSDVTPSATPDDERR